MSSYCCALLGFRSDVLNIFGGIRGGKLGVMVINPCTEELEAGESRVLSRPETILCHARVAPKVRKK